MSARSGAKGRKVHRQQRKPAHLRYVAEKRSRENKERRQRRHNLKTQKKINRKLARSYEILDKLMPEI